MLGRVFIIHGWGAGPDNHWLPWLKSELEKQGFNVQMPEMPDSEAPKIDEWVSKLAELVGELDENTYFVGHSIGCQAIMRYLETQTGRKAGGCVFVAGWFKLENVEEELEDKSDRRVVEEWTKDNIDFERVKSVCDNFVVLNSSNDDFGAVGENRRIFEEKLGAKVTVMENMGHFTKRDGVVELPQAVGAIQGFQV